MKQSKNDAYFSRRIGWELLAWLSLERSTHLEVGADRKGMLGFERTPASAWGGVEG